MATKKIAENLVPLGKRVNVQEKLHFSLKHDLFLILTK